MFKTANIAACVQFNSATSSEILNKYEGFVLDSLKTEKSEPSSKTFAPSSFRCNRKNWFRLRGVDHDVIAKPDVTLEFLASLGTHIHADTQMRMKQLFGEDWISVDDYLAENPIPYKYTTETSGLETKVSIEYPPIHFAVDGIIRYKGKMYLLEIKTCDHSSFDSLTDPKPMHLDQIKFYSTILQIPDVLVMYIDRQYGTIKLYEMRVSTADNKIVLDTMKYILSMVDANIAPDRLNYNDYMCTNCEYKHKCKDWG